MSTHTIKLFWVLLIACLFFQYVIARPSSPDDQDSGDEDYDEREDDDDRYNDRYPEHGDSEGDDENDQEGSNDPYHCHPATCPTLYFYRSKHPIQTTKGPVSLTELIKLTGKRQSQLKSTMFPIWSMLFPCSGTPLRVGDVEMTPVERIYMMNEMKSSKTFGTVLQLAWRIFGMKPDLHSDQLRLRWMYKLKCGPTIRKYFVLLVMLCRCLANLGFVEEAKQTVSMIFLIVEKEKSLRETLVKNKPLQKELEKIRDGTSVLYQSPRELADFQRFWNEEEDSEIERRRREEGGTIRRIILNKKKDIDGYTLWRDESADSRYGTVPTLTRKKDRFPTDWDPETAPQDERDWRRRQKSGEPPVLLLGPVPHLSFYRGDVRSPGGFSLGELEVQISTGEHFVMNHLEDMDFLLPIPLIATNYGLQQIDKYGLSESECEGIIFNPFIKRMYLEGVNSVLRHLGVEWIIFHTAQLLMYDQRIGHLVNSQNYRKQLIHDVITSLYYCGYPKQSAAVALMFGLREITNTEFRHIHDGRVAEEHPRFTYYDFYKGMYRSFVEGLTVDELVDLCGNQVFYLTKGLEPIKKMFPFHGDNERRTLYDDEADHFKNDMEASTMYVMCYSNFLSLYNLEMKEHESGKVLFLPEYRNLKPNHPSYSQKYAGIISILTEMEEAKMFLRIVYSLSSLGFTEWAAELADFLFQKMEDFRSSGNESVPSEEVELYFKRYFDLPRGWREEDQQTCNIYLYPYTMLMGPDEFKHTLKNEDTAGATSSDTEGRLGLHARAERKPKKKFYQKGKKSTGIKMDINPDFFPEKGVNTAKRPEYPYPQPPPESTMADSNGFSRDGRDLGARPRDNQGQRRGDRRQTGRSGDGRRRDYRNSGNVRQRGRDQTHRDDQRGRYPQRQRNNQFINARDLSDHRQNRGGNNGRGGPPDMVYTGVGGRQQRAHGRPVVSQEDEGFRPIYGTTYTDKEGQERTYL